MTAAAFSAWLIHRNTHRQRRRSTAKAPTRQSRRPLLKTYLEEIEGQYTLFKRKAASLLLLACTTASLEEKIVAVSATVAEILRGAASC